MTSSNSRDALRIYGNLSLLEMAPVLLAADGIYAATTVIEHGSVPSLWGQGSELPSLASSGHADLAANSETQALRYSFDHRELRFIFTLAACPYRIVARRSAGIARLTDLRGKRVGTMPKSSAQYFLDRILRSVGLSSTDVTIVPHMAKTAAPLSLLPRALRDGTLDAVTVWEPQIQQAKLAIGADAIEFCDPTLYCERFNLCSTQSKLDDPALRPRIVAFVRALIDATRRLQSAPQRAQALVARAARLDVRTVEASWPYLTYPGTLVPDLLDALVPVDAWVAKETGRSGRTATELGKLIDPSILRDAVDA